MQFGVVIPTWGEYWADPGRIREAIVAADALGYETAWFGDHIVIPDYAVHLSPPQWFDALACALVGAGLTRRIRFATDVLVLAYRNPVELSQLLASADQLSGGRITLGVGVGYMSGEFVAVGAPPYERRGAVTDEYLDVLRTIWSSSGSTAFSGEWVNFAGVQAGPPPLQQPLPIWVGGNAAPALRRAALRGDGWHPLFPSVEEYRASRSTIEAYRGQHGLQGPFTYSMSCKRSRLLLSPEESIPVIPAREDVPDEYGYAPRPPVAATGRARFTGTVSEVLADVAEYATAGVEHIALRLWNGEPAPDLADWLDQLERFATHILPAARHSPAG
jgi:probable F420-dependent oxidoreductase